MKKKDQKTISYLLPAWGKDAINNDAKWRFENGFFQKHNCYPHYQDGVLSGKVTLRATDLQITLISLKYKICK